jgi:pantoate--beta-alanine ligase
MSRPRSATKFRVSPRIARTRTALRHELLALRAPVTRGARSETLAFVPTMGALHDGHRALIRHARESADHVVVSIFVNPLQFGPDEDLDRYPRNFEADVLMCEEEGVELVFAPDVEAMYPQEQLVTIDAGPLGERFEGEYRPGHFDGVLTVVCKLVNLVSPDYVVMGEKDAQQLVLVRRMLTDLGIPTRVVGHPTVRDDDGLALSSRNRYLTAEQRVVAAALPRALFAGRDAAGDGADAVLAAARAVLGDAADVGVDYLALVEPEELAEVAGDHAGPALLLAAVRVGQTRLIDNVAVGLGDASSAGSAEGGA